MDEDVNGNPMMNRVAGIPLVVWVLIVAGVAYFFISRRRSATSGGVPGTGGSVSYGAGGTARANTVIDKGAVTINVSQDQPGPPMHKRKSQQVTVPDVRGQRYESAAESLTDAGLRAERSSPYVGKVTRESPHSGSKVPKGTMITLSGANKGNTKPWPGKKDNE